MSFSARRSQAFRPTAAVVVGFLLASAGLFEGSASGQSNVRKTTLGTTGGKPVELYILTNADGLEVQVMTYGATLTRVRVPDRSGRPDDVTLYLDTVDNYLAGHPLFGSVVGRYANRIDRGGFAIDGVEYKLAAGKTGVHIHGGKEGFQRLVWDAVPIREESAVGVVLTHTSPDGHEGYPGKLDVTVTYKLTDDNELVMDYKAVTDKPTQVNLTNHAYWNLAGAGSGDVLDHVLILNADHFLPTDDRKIPLGELKPVAGTPMDFTAAKSIGSRIADVPGGYDHCYVLNKAEGERLSLCARVEEPKSGRVMEVYTTQPGVQLYTANGLSSKLGADGFRYGPHHGFCLETQHYPDSPNKPQFPSTLLRPGQTYHEVTVHKFYLRD